MFVRIKYNPARHKFVVPKPLRCCTCNMPPSPDQAAMTTCVVQQSATCMRCACRGARGRGDE